MTTTKASAEQAVFERAFEFANASPERVFRALTDPAQLRIWFAEHARVEPRVGGAYAFWGRHTAWVSSEKDANQRITEFEAGRMLAFSWRWFDIGSQVRLTVDRSAEGTRVSVRHTADRALFPGEAETVWFLADLWRVSMGNLREYLRTGKPALLPDFAYANRGVHMAIEIAVPPERVFEALTDPTLMNKWIASAAVIEPRVGGAYSYGWSMKREAADFCIGPAKILEIDPPRRLVTDWHYFRDPGVSRMAWDLEPLGGGSRTRLTLTHVGITETEPGRGGYNAGWASFAVELKHFLELGIVPRQGA